MKRSREQIKAELLKRFEQEVDEILDWQEQSQAPNLSQFEEEILAARKVRMPVVVITAHDEPGTAEQVRALGGFAYLKEPIDKETLFSVLASALAQSK